MRFADNVAIIAGGAQGIGLSCARRLAKEGAKIVIADINEAAGTAAVKDLQDNGADALYAHVDVSERLDVHNMMAATLDTYDRIDMLVNNAGIVVPADFLDLSEENFDRVLRINLKGAFLIGQAVARRMVEQLEAAAAPGRDYVNYSIVNISSVSAVTASGDNAAYAASKAGLNQLTRAMALALAPHGIRVNAVGPGNITSGDLNPEADEGKSRKAILARTPLGRIGDADEIASIVAFLASEDAAYVTGQCLYADGGRLALNYTMEKKDEV